MMHLEDCIAVQTAAAQALISPSQDAVQDGNATAAAAYAVRTCELMLQVDAENASFEGDFSSSLNALFTLACAVFVVLMQAGFAMLCAGSVRTKNTVNIVLLNVVDVCVCALMFFFIGHAVAYGQTPGRSPNGFVGSGDFALSESNQTSDYLPWFFQFSAAAAATTIVAGSVAERCVFGAYLGYAALLSAWVYPVVVHWIWSEDGWLSAAYKDPLLDIGAIDFAGCMIVHLIGGLSGLIGAFFLGPRLGRFDADGKPADEFRGHSAILVALGTFLLWVGWYGFNPGSALAIASAESAQIVARAAITTTLAGGAAGVASAFWNRYMTGHFDLVAVCNGILAGLVSITSASACVEPWAAIVIGATGAILFERFEFIILEVLKIDDPLSASAMHGGCGTFGALVVGFFARKKLLLQSIGHVATDFSSDRTPEGLFYGGNGRILGCQIVGVVVVSAWVCAWMVPYFWGLRRLGLLRVSAELETVGLDNSERICADYGDGSAKDVVIAAVGSKSKSRSGSNYLRTI